MNRNSDTDVIILKNARIGDIHKSVTMLSAELGLISAVAHGAYSQKGKLRGVTNPFFHGHCYLYSDPVKKSLKVTDLVVTDYFPGLRESVSRFYTASLWAELVLKTFGGESDRLFELLLAALRAVDGADDCSPVMIQFLWRYLELSGLQPDLGSCASCDRTLAHGDARRYHARHFGFLCVECADGAQGADADPTRSAGVPGSAATVEPVSLGAGAAAYLLHTGALEFAAALSVGADRALVGNAKRVLYRLAQDVAETPLNTLRIGGGIL